MFDPKKEPGARESAKQVVEVWQAIAEDAAHVASAKRKLYLAYISEGFTEGQALELCKTI